MVIALSELVEYQLFVNKPALALSNAERALALATRQASDDNVPELAETKFMFARALWDSGRDRARARALALEAQPTTVGLMRTTLDTWLRDHPKP